MSLLLLFAGSPAGGVVVVTPPPVVEQGGPMVKNIRQIHQWQQKWEDEDFAVALAALLLL